MIRDQGEVSTLPPSLLHHLPVNDNNNASVHRIARGAIEPSPSGQVKSSRSPGPMRVEDFFSESYTRAAILFMLPCRMVFRQGASSLSENCTLTYHGMRLVGKAQEFLTMTLRDDLRNLSDSEFEELFDKRNRKQDLKTFFGPENYEQIKEFRDPGSPDKRKDARSPTGHTVFILPGIMGSELSVRPGTSPEKIWFSYSRIFVEGRLLELSPLITNNNVFASGVLRDYYYKLKVGLEKRGLNCRFFPFDWRLSIEESGNLLVHALNHVEGTVDLVCHMSMAA